MIRLALVFAFCLGANAAIPPMKIKPLGKPEAPVKGTMIVNFTSESENFSPIAAADYGARMVYEYVVEGLLRINPETYEFEPELAERYEVSKDYLTYTFYLNKNAKFSDGKPVTAEDVKFSVEAVRNPAYEAASRIPYYDDVAAIEIVDPHTIRFKMKKKYFKTLEVLGTEGYTPIVPKHVYQDPKKRLPIAPIYGSGPYKVEAYNRGKNIILVRNPDYWGNNVPGLKSVGKFQRITVRFIKEDDLQLEMMKKGQLDFMFQIGSESFEKKAVGEPFGTKIKKVQAENKIPKPWSYVAWNNKHPIFKDRDVRVALAHLFNRKTIMQKFTFGKSVEARGPVDYNSPFMPADVKPIPFNPAKAKAILTKAGWADADKNGVLEKTIDGKKKEFRFTLLLPSREAEKYFTIFKEDLRKAGIDMQIKLIEWSTFTKLLDEQKFDAVTLSWAGGSPEGDLKQIWHSDSARPGGSNFISYSNKEVDKLIDQARQEMNRKKRAELWKKAVRLIANDAPYAFMFNPKYSLFLHSDKLAYDKPTYLYDFSYHYWYAKQ